MWNLHNNFQANLGLTQLPSFVISSHHITYLHDERAGREALSDVVECLAGVGARVLGEYLRDLEEVAVAAARVDKVLGRLDLLLVVQPDHVVPAV